MIGRLDEVVVDPATLSSFWAQILGGSPRSRDPDWWSIEPPDAPQVSFQLLLDLQGNEWCLVTPRR